MASADDQSGARGQSETGDLRVVLLAPHGRDAALIGSLLEQERIVHIVVGSVGDLLRSTGDDYRAGLIVLTEESADASEIDELSRFLGAEPNWSDLPILLLARPDSDAERLRSKLNRRNGHVLRRPLQPSTLLAAVEAAIEIRRRQYEVRDLLHSLRRRARQLRRLTLRLSDAEERERRRLAVYVHDDLQQTLAGVMFHLDITERRLEDPEKLRSALGRVRRLVRDAIGGTRSLAHELSPAALRRNGLVAALRWLAGHVEKLHGVRVNVDKITEVDLPDESTSVFLFRAAQELLLNVAKHARTDSAEIGLRRESDDLELSVVDRGAGFRTDYLEDDDGPSSFGLFSIYERAELLGGTMRVESAPGEGTAISVRVPFEYSSDRALPATEAPEHGLPGETAEDRVPADGEPVRVLLVDDHVVVRTGLRLVLEEQSRIEILGECDNGREAVEAADRARPDLILMDVAMPGMDGIEATREIRRFHPEIRIIGLSMFDDPETHDKMIAAGAERYLSKAGPSDTLVSAILSPA